ncbi:MAG: SDR family oxidoreductase [Chitinophagales bacterium]
MKYFNDKVVWITGASSGIGEAIVKQLAGYNTQIVISARNEDQLNQLKSSLNLLDERCLVVPLDLAETALLAAKTKEVINHFGRIDILINNAGLSFRGLVADTDLSVYRKLMEVNYFGTIELTKSVLPYMMEQKSGHIAVTTSIAGKVGTQIRSAYCGAKHALHGFFDCLRMEVYQNNIDVTIIVPGFVKTELTKKALTENGSEYDIVDDAILNGMTPEKCANIYLKSLANKKEEVIISEGKEIIAPYLKRFFPSLLTPLLKRLPVK